MLPDVTLICVSGVNLFHSVYALWASSKNIKFGAVKIISPHELPALPSNIEAELPVGTSLDSIDEYSKYIIYELWRHVDTKYCLVVQADGFVVNPKAWKDEFLDFDYVGAPWPLSETAYIDPFGVHQRVGNGGFSLRSRKLLLVPTYSEIPWEVNTGSFYRHQNAGLYSEDGNICVHNRHIFESAGCVWPGLELASSFSIETKITERSEGKTFGFHKRYPTVTDFLRHSIMKLAFGLAWFTNLSLRQSSLRKKIQRNHISPE